MDLTKFSSAILASYNRIQDAKRPIDKKTARAEFDGYCKAADALGLVGTPTHMEMIVLEAVRSQSEPRPPRNFTSPTYNAFMVAWGVKVAIKIGTQLDNLTS